MPSATAPVSHYSRQDAVRILRLHSQQVISWQRAGLIPKQDEFSFSDLAQMRRLRDLRQTRITVRSIRSSVEAMQRVAGLQDPLREIAAQRQGGRLVFRHSGALLDPVTQQLSFDFEHLAQKRMSLIKRELPREQAAREMMRAQEVFQRAVQMEENAETADLAADLYREVLEICPRHAPACINLGTVLYNRRRFDEAEAWYRAAAVIDPEYALAHFDLGNVLDELRRLPEAIASYSRAIQLVPMYADADYNLALALERTGERRRALRHWLRYVRLDPVGPWAAHARLQARRTLASERLSIVSRYGKIAG